MVFINLHMHLALVHLYLYDDWLIIFFYDC